MRCSDPECFSPGAPASACPGCGKVVCQRCGERPGVFCCGGKPPLFARNAPPRIEGAKVDPHPLAAEILTFTEDRTWSIVGGPGPDEHHCDECTRDPATGAHEEGCGLGELVAAACAEIDAATDKNAICKPDPGQRKR